MFETISNTDANFLNLHIDKARKIQYRKINKFIYNTFYNMNFQTKLFTAYIKCNGTVSKKKVILFLS